MLELFSKRTKSSPELFSWFKSAKNTTNPSITTLTTAGNHKVGFEDILFILRNKSQSKPHFSTYKDNHIFWLINTLPPNYQEYVIPHTIPCQMEEKLINDVLNDLSIQPTQYYIVLYGKHSTDDTVDKKYLQLINLGFTNVFIYYGGLFEWLLLQDIYSKEHFPLQYQNNKPHTEAIKDLLSMGPPSKFTNII